MSEPAAGACQCPGCQSADEYAERRHHQQMNLLLSRLSEPQRRWYAALESNRLGYGGDQLVAQVTGLDEETIRRGRAELADELAEVPVTRQRRPGAGRPPAEKKTRP
jgi:hypothetical protein